MAEAMENAWWNEQMSFVGETDEALAVVGPRSDTTAEELMRLGQSLKEWQLANTSARHIWGLDDLLEGRKPRTPPVYLEVPYNRKAIGECYEPVALVFVAATTDHGAASESLANVLDELRGSLAWFTNPADYGYAQR
jgi:hypothetical protein